MRRSVLSSEEIAITCAGIPAKIVAPSQIAIIAKRDFGDFIARGRMDSSEDAFTIEFVKGSPDLSGFREGAEGVFVSGSNVIIRNSARFRGFWMHWVGGLKAKTIRIFVDSRVLSRRAGLSRWVSGDFMTPSEQVVHDVFYQVYLPRLLFELLDHDYAMIHAAGLVNAHGAWIIAGDAEVGKTRTLLDLASNKGLLGDDLLVIGGGEVHALPKKVGVFGYHTNHGYVYRGIQDWFHWQFHRVIAQGYSRGLRHLRRTMPLSHMGTVIQSSKIAKIIFLGRTMTEKQVASWTPEGFVEEMVRIMLLEVLNLMNAGKLLTSLPEGLDWLSAFVARNKRIMIRELGNIPVVKILLPPHAVPSHVLCAEFPELRDPLAESILSRA